MKMFVIYRPDADANNFVAVVGNGNTRIISAEIRNPKNEIGVRVHFDGWSFINFQSKWYRESNGAIDLSDPLIGREYLFPALDKRLAALMQEARGEQE